MNMHPIVKSVEWVATRQKEDETYFRKLGVPYTLEGLSNVLLNEKPKSAMPSACHGLANLKAIDAVPLLKRLATYPKSDVKACSVLAVARMAEQSETKWLVECLSLKGTDKTYVLWALAIGADPAAFEAVRDWFDPVLRKIEKKPDSDPAGKHVVVVAYLEQIAHLVGEAQELLNRYRVVVPSLDSYTRGLLATSTVMFGNQEK